MTDEGHRVKLATTVKAGRRTVFYVWECICGASSPLYETKGAANDAYRRHKEGSVAATHLPAFEDGPRTREIM